MKLATLAVVAAALLSNAAIAADTPAPSAPSPAAASTPAAPDAAKSEHKSKSSDASGPKSPQARCAAKIGHSTGDNKWEFKGDKAEKAYVACVAKAD